MPSRLTVAGLLASAALGATLLAGCTSSSDGSTNSSGSSATSGSVSAPATSAGGSSAPPQSSASVSTGAPPSGSPAGASCERGGLGITVERGSGASGTQFATLSFTNKTARTCTLMGFPAVSLRLNGAPLGLPADPSPKTPATVELAPGAVAVANLTDFSSCDASNSDTVRVSPPGSSVIVELPLQLRGCRLEVDPLTPS